MRRGFAWALGLSLWAPLALAELPAEPLGRSESLSDPSPHWAFVHDLLLSRGALLDLDRGEFLGQIDTGFLSHQLAFAPGGEAFYLAETYYSRGTRGERSDVVTFYETRTLAPVAEVAIPPRRAVNVLPSANLALSDDGRFLAVFNMNPATSLSIVDVERRRLAREIATPGCSLAYAAGARRFFQICSDGGLQVLTLDERGREAGRERIEPFFDPLKDPVTEKAVRTGDLWLFVSFEGFVHPIDVSGETLRLRPPWSLFDDADRAAGWRVGGIQHLAVHEPSGRLYSLVHQGPEHTHKEPGTELWIYDLGTRRRVERRALRHPGIAFLSETVEFGRDWPWPLNGLWDWMLDHVVPNPGIHGVVVTRDAEPLLVTGSQMGGSLAVYDARSGALLRRVASGNFTTHVIQAPWGGP